MFLNYVYREIQEQLSDILIYIVNQKKNDSFQFVSQKKAIKKNLLMDYKRKLK